MKLAACSRRVDRREEANLQPLEAVGDGRGRPASRSAHDNAITWNWSSIEFVELHGDKTFGDDRAIRAGLGQARYLQGHGHRPSERQDAQGAEPCFFGCAHPEGYRKAMAKMKMAAKFHLPVICMIDTPGAYPGIGGRGRRGRPR